MKTEEEIKADLKKLLEEGDGFEETTVATLLNFLETVSILLEDVQETADFFQTFFEKNVEKGEEIQKHPDMVKGATAYHKIVGTYLQNKHKDLALKAEVLMELIDEKKQLENVESVDNG